MVSTSFPTLASAHGFAWSKALDTYLLVIGAALTVAFVVPVCLVSGNALRRVSAGVISVVFGLMMLCLVFFAMTGLGVSNNDFAPFYMVVSPVFVLLVPLVVARVAKEL